MPDLVPDNAAPVTPAAPSDTPPANVAPANPAPAVPNAGADLPGVSGGNMGAPANTGYGAVINGGVQQPAPNATPNAAPNQPGTAPGQPNAAPNAAPNTPAADADHTPITDWAKVDLQLGNAQVDGSLVEGFGAVAKECGMTPAQARAAVQYQVQAMQRMADENLAAEKQKLTQAWGKDYDANMKRVENLCNKIAQVPGCQNFKEELIRSGASSNAAVLNALHSLAQALGEDSHGRMGLGAITGKETALQGLQAEYNRARGIQIF